MELSDEKDEKQETITRLAICVVIALILYYGAEPLCTTLKLPFWEQYKPWLEKNHIQAIAVVAAILFGISLAVFPLKEVPISAPDGFGPCEEGDFQPVG